MTSHNDNTPCTTSTARRKSSILAALTLNCNLPTIPIINEPPGIAITTANTTVASPPAGDIKKKSLRFDTNTLTTEYETEEVKETKRRIKDEIKR